MDTSTERPVQRVDESQPPRIDLRVLSPGHGVPETIDIRDVPVTTSVDMLKDRISKVSPSRPAIDGQRLIYQGHVLANPSATLADVFGLEAVCLATGCDSCLPLT